MLDLFREYRDSSHITEAILVGRNLFNQNPSDKDIFTEYFDLLCSLAECLPMLMERKQFLEQAEVALAFYSENAKLDVNAVSEIAQHEQELSSLRASVSEAEKEARMVAGQMIEENNTKQINKLYTQKSAVARASTETEFNQLLAELAMIDRAIDKDVLTDKQAGYYDLLTKECTELISQKMREFEHKANIEYNRKAVESFATAFQKFKNDENRYKGKTQLNTLVSNALFAYDASRLFNETLIYYNHIYSYIFNKLDDKGKLELTRLSIECERKLRA